MVLLTRFAPQHTTVLLLRSIVAATIRAGPSHVLVYKVLAGTA